MSAIDLIVSILTKRPAHKEQHLCADKAYDATDVREFLASEGYTAHIKVNLRRSKKGGAESSGEPSQGDVPSEKPHPARRWVVERDFAWASRFRRLVKDYERLPETLAGLHFVAFACLFLQQATGILFTGS